MSTAMLPYWPSVTPPIPTSAWAIMPSAGDRRGSVGMAATSYSRRANAAASWTERCGRLPTPVHAPARRRSPSGGTWGSVARGANRVGASCRTGRWFDQGHRRSFPSPTPDVTQVLSPVLLHVTSRWRVASEATHVSRWRVPSANLHAVTPPRATPPPSARVDWGRVMLWVARAAWLAVAVVGGRAVGDAVGDRSDAVQLVATVGAWVAWGCGAVALAVAVGAEPDGGARDRARRRRRRRDDGLAGGAGRQRARAARPGARRRRARRRRRDRAGVRAIVGVRRRAALPAAPALGYLAAAILSWAVWVTAVIAAPLAWAAGAWVLAAVASVVAVTATWVLPVRWHQLSRRWFVAVPGRPRRPRPGRARRDGDDPTRPRRHASASSARHAATARST